MDISLTSGLFWFLLGIVFLLAELTHYWFIFFFFGIGAVVVSLLTWAGLTNALPVQLIVFLITSLLSLYLFRSKMSSVFKGKVSGKLEGKHLDDVTGHTAVVVIDIKPNAIDGRVEYHGTVWEAHAEEMIEKGKVVKIVERKNLVLRVRQV